MPITPVAAAVAFWRKRQPASLAVVVVWLGWALQALAPAWVAALWLRWRLEE